MKAAGTGSSARHRRRRGLTLVELLMVVFILVILVAVTLPIVRPALQGRKIREAARQVNVYFATAQAMASEKGRPVGVWIERSTLGDVDGDGLPDAAAGIELFLAEIAPPYTGDLIGATGVPYDAAVAVDMIPPVDINNSTTDGIVEHLLLDSSSLFLLTLVRPGDLIRFNNRGPLFVIQDANGDGVAINDWTDPMLRPMWVPTLTPEITHSIEFRVGINWQPGLDARWGVANSDDDGDGTTDNLSERGWSGSDDYFVTDPPVPPAGTRVSFEIFRGPTKTGAPPLSLPPGTAIDLHHSGIGAIGQQFRADNAGAAVSPLNGPVLDDQPVIIMFHPTGEIRSVHYGVVPRNASGEAAGVSRLAQFLPAGAIHLLIGETDKFQQAEPPDPSNVAEVAFFTNNNVDRNLASTDGLWISVNQRTGNITSSPNGWQAVPVGSPTLLESLLRAREFARTKQTAGGQ
ncbi:MAG: type II secretion system protein [Pirellulaceae bacterium]|nr:type II secretion system protein [Pirellulaceae bacterium]